MANVQELLTQESGPGSLSVKLDLLHALCDAVVDGTLEMRDLKQSVQFILAAYPNEPSLKHLDARLRRIEKQMELVLSEFRQRNEEREDLCRGTGTRPTFEGYA